MNKQTHVPAWETLGSTARAAQIWGHHQLVSNILSRAAAEARRSLGPLDISYARFLIELADIYTSGQRHDRAEECLREAIEIYKEHFGDDHPSVGLLMHELAECLQDKGENEEAAKCNETSRSILRLLKAS